VTRGDNPVASHGWDNALAGTCTTVYGVYTAYMPAYCNIPGLALRVGLSLTPDEGVTRWLLLVCLVNMHILVRSRVSMTHGVWVTRDRVLYMKNIQTIMS